MIVLSPEKLFVLPQMVQIFPSIQLSGIISLVLFSGLYLLRNYWKKVISSLATGLLSPALLHSSKLTVQILSSQLIGPLATRLTELMAAKVSRLNLEC